MHACRKVVLVVVIVIAPSRVPLTSNTTINNPLPFRWDKRIANFHIGSFAPGKDDNWPAANIERGTETYVSHYTSGLWSLLHLLSVSEAPMRQNPYAVMEGIASFVDNFFR